MPRSEKFTSSSAACTSCKYSGTASRMLPPAPSHAARADRPPRRSGQTTCAGIEADGVARRFRAGLPAAVGQRAARHRLRRREPTDGVRRSSRPARRADRRLPCSSCRHWRAPATAAGPPAPSSAMACRTQRPAAVYRRRSARCAIGRGETRRHRAPRSTDQCRCCDAYSTANDDAPRTTGPRGPSPARAAVPRAAAGEDAACLRANIAANTRIASVIGFITNLVKNSIGVSRM